MKQTISGIVCLALLVATCHASHLAALRTPISGPQNPNEVLPSAEALNVLSLGYPQLVADAYWLRAISKFGNKRTAAQETYNITALLERIAALDPYFASVYIFAGTALTMRGMDPAPAMRLMQEGEKRRPDVWRIPFLAGFNAYYVMNDYNLAARLLARAGAVPEAPKYVGELATRLAAEAGEPEIGLNLVSAVLEETDDPALVEEYTRRRDLLLLEVLLKHLNQASEAYTRRYSKVPKRLSDLQPLWGDKIPDDPLGGAFILDEKTGIISSRNDAKRLRLSPSAARR